MRQIFADRIDARGDAVALVSADGAIVTYRELAARADTIAARLGPKRRLVVLAAANTLSFVATFLGCLRARHVVAIAAGEAIHRIAAAFQPNVIATPRGDEIDIVTATTRDHDLHPELAVLLPTSGSTGASKLVKLSRTNIDANAESIGIYQGLTTDDRAITALSLGYSFGLSVLTSHLAAGASVVLTELSIVEPEFWGIVRRYGVTNVAGVPYSYEMLARQRFEFGELPRLRFLAQAGGRLAPELVKTFAALGAQRGFKLFVMYGQTEASPRMAYMPPDQVAAHPDCIGIPIPGGAFKIIGDDGGEVTAMDVPGELAYAGPNVMMGYATSVSDLARTEQIAWLKTGDIACRTASGFYRILGRVARFVKPFGVRVSLDELEARLGADGIEAAATGTDRRVVVGVVGAESIERVRSTLITITGLPGATFHVVGYDALPRLANGKIDYRALADTPKRPRPASYARQFWTEFAALMGFGRAGWSSVREIYAVLLAPDITTDDASFDSLASDSLAFVSVSLALEDYLGRVPEQWPGMTIAALERLKVSGDL